MESFSSALSTKAIYPGKGQLDKAADWLLSPYRGLFGGRRYEFVVRQYDRGADYEDQPGGRYEPGRKEYDSESYVQAESSLEGWDRGLSVLTLPAALLCGAVAKKITLYLWPEPLHKALIDPVPPQYSLLYAQKGPVDAKLNKQLGFAVAQQDKFEEKKQPLDLSFLSNHTLTADSIRDKPNQNRSVYFPKLNAAVAESPREINSRGQDKMEDSYLVAELLIPLGAGVPATLYGVFDGHSSAKPLGLQAAQFVKDRLPVLLTSLFERAGEEPLAPELIANTLCEACVTLDVEFRRKNHKCGTAINFVLVIENRAYTANVGDCRAMVVKQVPCNEGPAKGRTVIQLSEDAKTSQERFQKSALKVWKEAKALIEGVEPGPFEIDGIRNQLEDARNPRILGLQCARDIGLTGSCLVTPRPKITSISVADGDKFIIASDGFWDVVTCGQAAELLSSLSGLSTLEQAEYLRNFAIINACEDDIVVLVVNTHIDPCDEN